MILKVAESDQYTLEKSICIDILIWTHKEQIQYCMTYLGSMASKNIEILTSNRQMEYTSTDLQPA